MILGAGATGAEVRGFTIRRGHGNGASQNGAGILVSAGWSTTA